jgi:hypothetical protein
VTPQAMRHRKLDQGQAAIRSYGVFVAAIAAHAPVGINCGSRSLSAGRGGIILRAVQCMLTGEAAAWELVVRGSVVMGVGKGTAGTVVIVAGVLQDRGRYTTPATIAV